MRLLRSIGLLAACILCFGRTAAQTLVTDDVDAFGLMDALEGPGVTLSTPLLNGSTGIHPAAGTFVATGPTIPTAGVVLFTGDVNLFADSAHNQASSDEGFDVDMNDLEELLEVTVTDVTVLEFDLVPEHSTLQVTFQFGSEEYPEYVCSYSDGVGIFLDGPGIDGPFTNDGVNIATVPASYDPIAVNTVNGGLNNDPFDPTCPADNMDYFVDNEWGIECVFDGLTVQINGVYNVIPGEQYHLRIAVADAGGIGGTDISYDSGIILPKHGVRSVPGPLGVVHYSRTDALHAWMDVHGALHVNADAPITAVEVLDGLGRRVAEAQGEDLRSIDLPVLPNGPYIVRGYSDGRWSTGRVMRNGTF